MGQDQSYQGHTSVSQVARYKDKYGPEYSSGPLYSPDKFENDYKRHKPRRSGGSYKSDNSSTESSGYRSGSSTYESHSNRSSKNDYYCTSLYKNDHYKHVNKELYRPVKIKEKKHLQLLSLEKEEFKSARLKSYLDEAEKAKNTQKKAGIRNYTPKILSEEEQRKKVDIWI